MKTRAAVAFAPKQPLEIVELDLEGPKQGEVLVEIMATGICHTDAYTLNGLDSEGLFPSILGHEVAGTVNRIAKRGGAATVVARDQQRPYGVYADASHVYWLAYREGAVRRAARGAASA